MGPNGYWLEVAPKGVQTRLVLYHQAMIKGYENRAASIVFECDDVQETYEMIKAKGVTFKGEPDVMQWGTFVHFSDEDGNEFIFKG